jgi:polysaccharide biosynthesis/export protein
MNPRPQRAGSPSTKLRTGKGQGAANEPIFLRLIFVSLFFLSGCAASSSNLTDEARSVAGAAQTTSSTAGPSAGDKDELDKLIRLWQARSQEKSMSDYPVGPGDVVEISVPAIEELRANVARISGDGMITLPFIGKIHAAGLTEEELRQKVLEQLKQYMHNPRAVVFVKEYRSRQVAVVGAVSKPGLYNLTSGADTLIDLIAQAGGIVPGADPKIYLIPAEPAENGHVREIASTLPASLLRQDPAPLILNRTEPIVVDLKQVASGGGQQYLYVPVRPGDIIMVPGGGQVLVEGWVERPGAYVISPGLTVTGVVIQAGGQLFPADVNAVKIIRADRGGMKTFVMADLEKIKSGEAPDIPLQGGDIVEVSAQTSKLVPYQLYRFFTTIISVGVGGTIPIIR